MTTDDTLELACFDCGAQPGEPCFPDCLGAVIQQAVLVEEIERTEDQDPFGDLADAAEDRMFGDDR